MAQSNCFQRRLISKLYSTTANGLLQGVSDVKEAKHYSKDMNLVDAADFMKDHKYIYNSALKDAGGDIDQLKKNLVSIRQKSEELLYSKESYGTSRVENDFNKIVSGTSDFVTFLGGHDTGKSLIMRKLSKENMNKVFHICCVCHHPLGGLLRVIEDKKKQLELRITVTDFVRKMYELNEEEKLIFMAKTELDDMEYLTLIALRKVLSNEKAKLNAVDLLKALIEEMDGIKITLVIDHADMFFTLDHHWEYARELLWYFPFITKTNHKANVILVSTDYDFVKNLEKNYRRLRFNTADIRRNYISGEVAPNEMYELLTTRYGVGENLALALISYFGGNLWNLRAIFSAIQRCEGRYSPSISSSRVQRCLKYVDEKANHQDKCRMREILKQMAETGVASFRWEENHLAEFISKEYVGGIVSHEDTIYGLDRSLIKEGYSVIPTSQFMRMKIANELVQDSKN